MGELRKLKIKEWVMIVLIVSFFFIITTPFHEAIHWLLAIIDPGLTPVEYHVFDSTAFSMYALGCVKYHGVRLLIPAWLDEAIALISQIIVVICLSLLILLKLLIPVPKNI